MTTDRYWFHVTELTLAEGPKGEVPLSDDQAHHARGVLRLETGTPVILFDGRGTWAEGTLQTHGKRDALARLTGAIQRDPEPAVKLTLATAVPKGERAQWLVEQASQLGAACVQWLDCQRGVAKPRGGGTAEDGGSGGGKLEKWRRLAVESAKQCGRTWVLRVEPLAGLEHVLASAAVRQARVLWLEPRAGVPLAAAAGETAGPQEIVALIGPEGGWSEQEMALLTRSAEQGVVARVKLTSTVLRIETACAAVAAVVGCR